MIAACDGPIRLWFCCNASSLALTAHWSLYLFEKSRPACDTAAIRVLGSDDSSHIQQLFQNERTAIGESVQNSGAVAAMGTAWSSDGFGQAEVVLLGS